MCFCAQLSCGEKSSTSRLFEKALLDKLQSHTKHKLIRFKLSKTSPSTLEELCSDLPPFEMWCKISENKLLDFRVQQKPDYKVLSLWKPVAGSGQVGFVWSKPLKTKSDPCGGGRGGGGVPDFLADPFWQQVCFVSLKAERHLLSIT